MRRGLAFLFVCVVAGGSASTAGASQLLGREAAGVTLQVNRAGYALVRYHSGKRQRHIVVWGPVNARNVTPGQKQVELNVDYSGGHRVFHKWNYWKTFKNACRPYNGPKLSWLVTTCKAPDGSYWALQSWQTPLPDLGFTPFTQLQKEWELHISHWTGPIAALEVYTDWVYGGRFHEVFGRYTYRGQPVYGTRTSGYGAPLDSFGRLIYLDTYDSRYGKGWRRENSFVPHRPSGVFCYGFYTFDPHKSGYVAPPGYKSHTRGPGNGTRYRLIANGPGLTPDVTWEGPGLHNFDAKNPADVAYEGRQNGILDQLAANDPTCQQH